MNEDPVKSLIEELGAHLSQKEHSDIVLNNGKGKAVSHYTFRIF